MKTQQLEVTDVAAFVRRRGKITEPVELTLGGKVVARLVPPGELSEAEKAAILRKSWAFVQRARAHNKGVPEREIAKVVNAAVNRVRSRQCYSDDQVQVKPMEKGCRGRDGPFGPPPAQIRT